MTNPNAQCDLPPPYDVTAGPTAKVWHGEFCEFGGLCIWWLRLCSVYCVNNLVFGSHTTLELADTQNVSSIYLKLVA